MRLEREGLHTHSRWLDLNVITVYLFSAFLSPLPLTPFHLSSFVRSLVRLPFSCRSPTHCPFPFPRPHYPPPPRSLISVVLPFQWPYPRYAQPPLDSALSPLVFLTHVQCIRFLPSVFNCVLPCFSFRSRNGLCIHTGSGDPHVIFLLWAREVLYMTLPYPLCVIGRQY